MSATTATDAAAVAGTIEAINPATHERLGEVPITAAAELPAILDAIAEVQPLWAQLRLSDRGRYVRRTAQAVIDEFDSLCQLLAREQGRPPVELATLELLPAIDTLRWIGDNGPRLLGAERIPTPRSLFPRTRARVVYEPAGIVAVIGSGSAPFAQPLCQIAAALMGGNGVVFKPAPRAALAAERVLGVLSRAALPEGLVRVVHGGADTGRAVVADRTARVLFSGNAGAGRDIARVCGAASKGAVLELGGADAMIVLDDAHVPSAAAGAIWAACAAAGQAHGSVKRVLVARELHDGLVEQLVAQARALTLGDPLAPGTQLGPLASARRRERLQERIDAAVASGATLRCGGAVQPGGLAGAFFEPAVLTGVTPEMRFGLDFIAGPVIAVTEIESVDQAIALANADERGLGASIWTADRYRAQRIARELQAGMVWINDHLPGPVLGPAPWGAVKGGSHGRSYGAEGMRACVEPKVISWAPPSWRGPFWHPYDDTTSTAARTIAQLRSARDSDREQALRHGLGALARLATRSLRGSDPRR
jgi:succinate-semialdehyde dehydrogenase/glutarate-semialdehyde dehydrogenase